MKDYFAILELSKDCSIYDIKKSYRRLAKKFHPDVNKTTDAHEKFIEISEAYEFLINYKGDLNIIQPTFAADKEKKSDYRVNEMYEKYKKEAREKAHQQARMRYEEFKKQHNAFQESGINDLALLFKILFRTALIPVSLFLFLLPVYIALHNEWGTIFLLFLTWPFAGIVAWYIHGKRKNYFKPGKFYYNLKKIIQTYTESNPTGQKCYYCKSKPADSRPFRIDLLKLQDVKVQTTGYRQHNVNYINKNVAVLVPRSRKAFIVHSINTIIKIISIFGCLLFIDISSYLWRIIIGIFLGGLISNFFLTIMHTKSNVAYLISIGWILRIIVWMFCIAMVSELSISPFNIKSSVYIYLIVFSILFLDCFLMQLLNLLLGKYAVKPIIKQYESVNNKFNEGYKVYNDVMVISVIYPAFKWIFG